MERDLNLWLFFELTISDLIFKHNIITNDEYALLLKYGSPELIEILNMKVKNHYQFKFLTSNEFREWIKDPVRIDVYFN